MWWFPSAYRRPAQADNRLIKSPKSQAPLSSPAGVAPPGCCAGG